MKIRTNFVTNSSSVSTTEVVIDNLVLLEILAKYQQLGTFDEVFSFNIGSIDSYHWPESKIKTKTPAIYLSLIHI